MFASTMRAMLSDVAATIAEAAESHSGDPEQFRNRGRLALFKSDGPNYRTVDRFGYRGDGIQNPLQEPPLSLSGIEVISGPNSVKEKNDTGEALVSTGAVWASVKMGGSWR
ncbi:hypothetical protein AYI69_g2976 [Smittium culicis]|uniref:Uncharacterized protein n=1 Tax=Smittium culicis TaxID=133412 RepID=A0A1R1YL28_9FUNG|nr:hypothetical protein AYI69_g2976 [Smittium culicis]